MKHYRKAIVAVIAAAVVIGSELLIEGSAESVIQVTTMLIAPAGVYGLYNDPKEVNK